MPTRDGSSGNREATGIANLRCHSEDRRSSHWNPVSLVPSIKARVIRGATSANRVSSSASLTSPASYVSQPVHVLPPHHFLYHL